MLEVNQKNFLLSLSSSYVNFNENSLFNNNDSFLEIVESI